MHTRYTCFYSLPLLVPAWACLPLDGPADLPQMPPEGVGRFGCAARQVLPEGRLLAQGLTRLDLASLGPFGLGDLAGCGQDLRRLIGRDEHDTIVVA